jgi:hypothetical protein
MLPPFMLARQIFTQSSTLLRQAATPLHLYSASQANLEVSNYEKITIARPVITFPALHGTRRFGICTM